MCEIVYNKKSIMLKGQFMFVISSFEITGFWNSHKIKCNLDFDTNIFIGLNGSGKTTLINILQAVLTVDMTLLHSISFESVKLQLKNGSINRTISVSRQSGDFVYDMIKYKISRDSYLIPLVPNESDIRRRFNSSYYNNVKRIKKLLEELVDISWLSVHRQLIQDDDYSDQSRRRNNDNTVNPVDARLMYLLGKLSDYHLGLQAQANEISTEFQKKVLESLLFNPKFDTYRLQDGSKPKFESIRTQLYHAYELMGFPNSIKKKIDVHVENIEKSISSLQKTTNEKHPLTVDDVLPYSLYKRTQEIVQFSIEADEKKKEIFILLETFINIMNEFLDGKFLALAPHQEYGLNIKNINEDIDFLQLSSGEKQLFILLIETVLQNKSKSIFIADEPELSLHVAWQRKLLMAVRQLNPNSQLIIATHSPEIAGPFRDSIIKMRDIIK